MAPAFIALILPTRKFMNSHVVAVIEKYYPILADGISLELPMVKDKYRDSNARFFTLVDKWEMSFLEELVDVPHFLISFDSNVAIDMETWDLIHQWVIRIFEGDDSLTDHIKTIIDVPVVIEPLPSVKSIEHSTPQTEYALRYIIDESRKLAIYEVTKPYTDRPYTCVIRNYPERTVLPFFTALFVCNSWGRTNLDIVFLYKIWDHLNMAKEHGPLDLENRLKEEVAKCFPDYPGGANAEPEVYRLSIEQLWEQWSNKRACDDFIELDQKKIKSLF